MLIFLHRSQHVPRHNRHRNHPRNHPRNRPRNHPPRSARRRHNCPLRNNHCRQYRPLVCW